MYRFRLWLWQLLWPPDKVRTKKQRWIVRKLARLIRGGTGGGAAAMTFWESVKAWMLLLLLTMAAAILYFAVLLSNFHG